MVIDELRSRVTALRDDVGEFVRLVAASAPELSADELFEVAGEVQRLLNAVDGAQLVAIAHAASWETRLTDRGPTEVRHPLGFVDAMAGTEVSLATGVGQWAGVRRAGLAARAAGRFPRLLSMVVEGDLCSGAVQKVVTASEGLDVAACAAVEAVLVPRIVDLDPSRVTSTTRRIATRVAADQVAAAQRDARRDRCVEVSPGPDGSTHWWAQLPAARSAAAWEAVRCLAATYVAQDESLTVGQARADAFLDLLLTNVDVMARVTIGIPVVTGPEGEAARDAAIAQRQGELAAPGSRAACADPTTVGGAAHAVDGGAGTTTQRGAGTAAQRPLVGVGGCGLGTGFSVSAALSGCEVPGVGWIDAEAVGALLESVPFEVGRALLDARTGTVVESVSTTYRPTRAMTDFVSTRDGTCRMWGCSRPADACDVDHARPWPAGPTSPTNLAGLCRRHHRLKQRRRWAYRLDPDGTATWISPHGLRRTTLPEHALLPSVPPPTAPTAPHHDPPPF